MNNWAWAALAIGGAYLFVKARESAAIVSHANAVGSGVRGIVDDVRYVTSGARGAVDDAAGVVEGLARITNAGKSIIDGFGDLFATSGSHPSASPFNDFF